MADEPAADDGARPPDAAPTVDVEEGECVYDGSELRPYLEEVAPAVVRRFAVRDNDCPTLDTSSLGERVVDRVEDHLHLLGSGSSSRHGRDATASAGLELLR